jgi:hypothetical protein
VLPEKDETGHSHAIMSGSDLSGALRDGVPSRRLAVSRKVKKTLRVCETLRV